MKAETKAFHGIISICWKAMIAFNRGRHDVSVYLIAQVTETLDSLKQHIKEGAKPEGVM